MSDSVIDPELPVPYPTTPAVGLYAVMASVDDPDQVTDP